jgi:LmbE family N-acetylglucosaminyl deacetylase
MSKVLVFAPHPDDEILGCGGTMIKHIEAGDEVYVCIATKGCMPLFSTESVNKTRSEALECHKSIGIKKTFFLDFPAAMMEKVERYEMNGKILDVIKEVQPDIVFIPHWGDMQKDHQMVADACMVALRPKYEPKVKSIFSYETMSETAWNAPNVQNEFIPNVFVDISDTLNKKIKALSVFKSQLSEFPDARSLEAVDALAKYRGALMHFKAAEAFMLIRQLL